MGCSVTEVSGYTPHIHITLKINCSDIYKIQFFLLWRNIPAQAYVAPFLRFRDHTQLDKAHSAGLLRTRDWPVAETST